MTVGHPPPPLPMISIIRTTNGMCTPSLTLSFGHVWCLLHSRLSLGHNAISSGLDCSPGRRQLLDCFLITQAHVDTSQFRLLVLFGHDVEDAGITLPISTEEQKVWALQECRLKQIICTYLVLFSENFRGIICLAHSREFYSIAVFGMTL